MNMWPRLNNHHILSFQKQWMGQRYMFDMTLLKLLRKGGSYFVSGVKLWEFCHGVASRHVIIREELCQEWSHMKEIKFRRARGDMATWFEHLEPWKSSVMSANFGFALTWVGSLLFAKEYILRNTFSFSGLHCKCNSVLIVRNSETCHSSPSNKNELGLSASSLKHLLI